MPTLDEMLDPAAGLQLDQIGLATVPTPQAATVPPPAPVVQTDVGTLDAEQYADIGHGKTGKRNIPEVPDWGSVESHPDFAELEIDKKLKTIDGWADALIEQEGAGIAEETLTFTNQLKAETRTAALFETVLTHLEEQGIEPTREAAQKLLAEAGEARQHDEAVDADRKRNRPKPGEQATVEDFYRPSRQPDDRNQKIKNALQAYEQGLTADRDRAPQDWQTVELGEAASFELRPLPHPFDSTRYQVKLPDGSIETVTAKEQGDVAEQVAKVYAKRFPDDVGAVRDAVDRVVRAPVDKAVRIGRGALTAATLGPVDGAQATLASWFEHLNRVESSQPANLQVIPDGVASATLAQQTENRQAFWQKTQFEAVDKALDKFFPTSQRTDAEGVADKGTGLRNSVLTGIGELPVTVGLAMIPGVGAAAAGTANYMASGQEAFDDAMQSGRPDEALGAFVTVGGANAIAETIGDKYLANMFGKVFAKNLDAVSPGIMGRFVNGARQAAKAGPVEGVTEAAQQMTLNAYAKQFYDENRDVFKDVPESAAVGLLVGAFAGGVAGTAQGGVNSNANAISEQQAQQQTQPPLDRPSDLPMQITSIAANPAARLVPGLVDMSGRGDAVSSEVAGVQGSPAFHGTPHKVDQFSTDKIGTGEGAQTFGWGLYFAEAEATGKFYRDTLAGQDIDFYGLFKSSLKDAGLPGVDDGVRALQLLVNNQKDKSDVEIARLLGNRVRELRGDDSKLLSAVQIARAKLNEVNAEGNLYKVDLKIEPDEYLDWEKPLSEQSVKVQKALEGHNLDEVAKSDTGKDFYQTIARARRRETGEPFAEAMATASKILSDGGIKGIRYLDGMSRSDGQGSFNFVVFDGADVEITDVNGNPLQAETPTTTTPTIQGSPEVKGAQVQIPDPLQQQPSPDATPIDAPAVLKSIVKVAEAAGSSSPLRTGNMSMKKAQGEFHVGPEMSRIRTANDIPTAAHEIGHAVQKGLFGKDNKAFANALPTTVRSELLSLGKALYGDKKPNGGYVSEGFAEYMRLYVTGGQPFAQTVAPEFDLWFANELQSRGKLQVALRQASDAALNFNRQGAWNRARQGIVEDSLKQRVSALRDRMSFNRINRAWFDNEETLRRFTEDAIEKAAAQGKALGANPYETVEARRMSADAIVGRWIEDGVTNRSGVVVAPSLREAAKPVIGKMQEFMVYLWARRTKALNFDPRGARNSGLAVQDAQTIIAEAEQQYPEFVAAAQYIYDWNDAVLDYAASASPDFAETVKRIRERDPGAYIPLQREFRKLDAAYGSLGTATKGDTAFKRMSKQGSGRRIKNPMESMIAQATATVQKAHEKMVLDQIIKAAEEIEGLGSWVVKVPRDMVPAAQSDAMAVLRDIQKRLDAVGGSIDVEDNGADLSDMMLTFFAPAQKPGVSEDPILPIIRDGKLQFYQMDGNLYKSLAGMNPQRMHKALDLTLGLSARTLRLGATGVNASFSLLTNPLRDFQTLAVNTRSDANIGRVFATYMRSMVESFFNVASGGKFSTREIEMFENMGGQMSQMLRQDIAHTRRAARRLFQSKGIRTIDPRNVFDFMRDLLSFPESAARITEIKLLAKQVGWEQGQEITEAQAVELLRAAKIVTTDFTAGGDLARTINKVVPFFNAGIQGPRAHVRAIRDHPLRFLSRGLMLTGAALAAWWRNKDEEWWQEMPAEQRYAYTYFPVEIDGRKEVLRIPRSFELGGLFMALPETMADAWYHQDPEGAASYFQTALAASAEWGAVFAENSIPVKANPLLMNPLTKEIYEQGANRDVHFDSPIVSRSQEDMPPEEQFTPYTTRLAIELGDLFKVSPARIDHAIRGFGGGTAADLAAVFGRGPSKDLTDARDARESEPADTAIIGRLFVRGGDSAKYSQSVKDFYDRMDFATLRSRSNREQESETQRQLRLQLGDASKALSGISQAAQLELTVDERRRLQKIKVDLAREAVKAFDSSAVNRQQFKAWKDEWGKK